MAVRIFQELLSACFKNACPDVTRLRVRIIQESCPDVTRIINNGSVRYCKLEIVHHYHVLSFFAYLAKLYAKLSNQNPEFLPYVIFIPMGK